MPTESLCVQTPDGMLDDKLAESASVDNRNFLKETSVPCAASNMEGSLPVEDPPSDMFWSDIKEDVPTDIPVKHSPPKGCIPLSFNKDFNSVLYTSCKDYQAWVAEAAVVMRNEGLLQEKVCNTSHPVCCFTQVAFS